ncbi:Protein of unknown function [Gryllus bimaculatus]|nr:Protein of unknown function [Gryllus bimaculatus]
MSTSQSTFIFAYDPHLLIIYSLTRRKREVKQSEDKCVKKILSGELAHLQLAACLDEVRLAKVGFRFIVYLPQVFQYLVVKWRLRTAFIKFSLGERQLLP